MLSLFWLLVAFIFFFIAGKHYRESKRSIGKFGWSVGSSVDLGSPRVFGPDINGLFREFVPNFNSFIEEYNKSNQRQNQILAFVDFLAGLTAIISCIMEFQR